MTRTNGVNTLIKLNNVHFKRRVCKMAKKDVHPQRFVWVKDKAGNEYVCRIDDLKDPKKVDKEDLKNCVDDASRAINIGD